MIEPPKPADESSRLSALEAMRILDTPPDERFDRITRVAAQLFNVPISIISMVDADRQWFKSRFGLAARETPRSVSFCGHTILQPGVFHIPDAAQDPRFSDNPLVEGDPHIRFYAGVPLQAPGGEALGTLCLIDTQPREFSEVDQALLGKLAGWAQETLNQRHGEHSVDQKTIRGWWLGVGSTLLAATLLELLSSHMYFTPAPPALLLIAVVFAAFQGGIGAGLTSSAIALVYLAHFYALPDQPLHYGGNDLWMVLTWGVAMPTISIMTGLLRRRAERQFETKMGDAVMAAHLSDITATHAELRISHERLRLVTENIPMLVAFYDEATRCRYANSAYGKWLGVEPDQMFGKRANELLADQKIPASEFDKIHARVFAGERIDREREHHHPDGRVSHLVVSKVPHFDDTGRVTGFYTFLNDVTSLKNVTLENSLARERLALALEGSNLCMWDWNLEEGTVFLDSVWSRMLGEEPHDTVLSALELFDLVHPDDKDMLYARWQAVLRGEQEFYAAEHRVKTRNGEWLWIASLGKIVQQTDGKKTMRMTGTNADISARKRAEERIELLATTDPLTMLPNRRVLADRLAHGMLNVERTGHAAFALLFIDLDRFKHVNDSLGHEIGDQVLKLTAQRINEATRKGDTVARLGGDEFAVVLAHMQKPEDAGPVAQKIIDALTEPYLVGEHTVNISCSIGVSIFPLDAGDAATLLRNADLAMYAAKERGRQGYQYFSPSMNAQVLERVTLEKALREALLKNEFELYYQPKISFGTGQLAGVEALVRWHNPQQGLISPARFIPIAEETRMILPIGNWVLRTACTQLVTWQKRWQVEISLAVNISVVQIDRSLCQTISAALRHSGLDARCLEIEITENVLLRNASETIEILREISALGVRIAIDDFGTGYSSLSYLRDFKVDTIKIDQSFVGNMLTQENAATIVRAIIALSHSMQMEVVAEGVETTAQKAALGEMGCDQWQGYLYAKPLPAPEFEQRMLATEVQV